jgi:choline dehydrogenase
VVTLNELAKGPRLAGQVARWLVGLPNILSQAPSQVYLFTRSRPELDIPDIQSVFTPGSYKEGKHYVLDDYPGATAGAWQHRPLSRGHVRARSTDIDVDPLIQPNYLKDPLDREVLVAGMRQIRNVLHVPALRKYLEAETVPGPDVQTNDEWLEYCRQKGSTGYHLCGTAKMGPSSDPMAVVDDHLRVHGLQALSVVDSSIMPSIPSANTYASTMMIAEKAADLIKSDSG